MAEREREREAAARRWKYEKGEEEGHVVFRKEPRRCC